MNAETDRRDVRIVLIYPSLLGIYGDRGNATVLLRRLRWRGHSGQVVEVQPGQQVPDDGDIYLLGGGEDAAQVSAANALRAAGAVNRAVDHGAVVLAVCAGYQLAGRSFSDGHGQDHPGLGLLDVATERAPERAVGEIATSWMGRHGDERLLTGFENHGGLTRLGPDAEPLATVEVGVGNGDGTDGAVTGRVVGTYAHGPVLARNPALADYLLEQVLGHSLSSLALAEVDRLRAERLAKAGVSRPARLTA